MRKPEFTKEQEAAFGRIMAANFGGHFQTGFTENGAPYVYVKMGPNTPVTYHYVYEDGAVSRV